MKRIIHIASDEKFINSAYWQFSSINNVENIFFIIVNDIDKKLKHVNVHKNIFIVSNNINELKKLGKTKLYSDLVCFHGLDYFSSLVLNNLPKKQKVLWNLFGKEIYHNPILYKKKSIIGEKTYNKFIAKNLTELIIEGGKNRFRGLLYLLKNITGSPAFEIVRAMKRSNYCGILYKEEFQLVKTILGTDIKHFKFTYYPIEKMLSNIESTITDTNILLGNSASHSNNHLEAFDILKRFDLKKHKVITPLSYGDRNYANEVVKIGSKELCNGFEPLVNFMPLHEYNNYLQSCGIAVMNHYRQQAVGNVLTMIWMGAKVYLDGRNSLFSYLKRIGVYVFEIKQDLNPENEEALWLLNIEQQKHNRECLKNEISQDIILTRLNVSINDLICP